MHATCTAVYDLKYDTDVCLVNFKRYENTIVTKLLHSREQPPPGPYQKVQIY